MDKLDELRLSYEELRDTGAAVAVAALRKHGEKEVGDKARELRDKWKQLAQMVIDLK